MLSALNANAAFAGHGLLLTNASVPRVDIPPLIDGSLDDNCWHDAARLNEFYIFARGPFGAATHDTEASLAHDGQWLFIGLKCHNANMQHLDLMGTAHDDAAIFSDDSVEILLGRPGASRYFWFILNYANVQGERAVWTGSGKDDIGWDVPWLSATRAGDQFWTAEIAVPLFIVNNAEPRDIGLNFIRNKIEVTLDQMNAKLTQKKVISAWSAADATPYRLIEVGGLRDVRAPCVFLPRIDSVQFQRYQLADGKLSVAYDVAIRNFSGAGGRAELQVVDRQASADGSQGPLFAAGCDLPGNATQKLAVIISAGAGVTPEFHMRGASGQLLQTLKLPRDLLLIADVFTERNYYTDEKQAQVKCRLACDHAILADCKLIIRRAGGAWSKSLDALQKETVFTVDTAELDAGEHVYEIDLIHRGEQVLAARTFSLIKRPSQPGREIKIDRFRRVILIHGEPFFMFGLWGNWARDRWTTGGPEELERSFQLLADSGFNTVQNAYRRIARNDPVITGAIMDLAGRHGLMVIDAWADMLLARDMDQAGYAKTIRPAFTVDFETVKEHPNLLGYHNLDEPNLGNWRKNLEVCEWVFRDIREIDPHRPVFLLYARKIPPGDDATRWGDVFGYDIYTYPGWERHAADVVNYMARLTHELDLRLHAVNKPVFIVPMATALDIRRSPLPLSYQEQLAQTYAALIYGAKGIIYFAERFTWGHATWAAFKELARHLEIIKPALLAMPVDHKIEYPPELNVDILKQRFPPVHAGLFKYTDGRLLLLAVNALNQSVTTSFKVAGLSQAARLLESESILPATADAFSDTLEPLGVRAYALEVTDSAPEQLTVYVQADILLSAQPESTASIDAIIKQTAQSGNLILNPSFERQTKMPGIPDFYLPDTLSGPVEKPELLGKPEHAHWRLETENPFDGRYCLKMARPGGSPFLNGIRGRYCLPPDMGGEPVEYVFSFYSRGQGHVKVHFSGVTAALNKRARYELAPEWRQYRLPVKLIKAQSPLVNMYFTFTPEPGSEVLVDAVELAAHRAEP